MAAMAAAASNLLNMLFSHFLFLTEPTPLPESAQ
jgi:hypothetical protein